LKTFQLTNLRPLILSVGGTFILIDRQPPKSPVMMTRSFESNLYCSPVDTQLEVQLGIAALLPSGHHRELMVASVSAVSGPSSAQPISCD
jgi:hypothetical protein